jgi:F0F1-type ATP synthase membrane subunit b/b'
MTGDQLTLGAVLARLEEREREIAAQADAAKERIAELSAQLEQAERVCHDVPCSAGTFFPPS